MMTILIITQVAISTKLQATGIQSFLVDETWRLVTMVLKTILRN